MLPSLDYYLYAKDQRYCLVLSSDIVDQRTLQSDWASYTTGLTQSKMVVSGTSLP